MSKKPSVQEWKDQIEICRKHYSGMREKFREDEDYYELNFKDKLNVPQQFHADRVVLPTARDVVDVAVNHTDIMNARVFSNKKGTSDISDKSAEMLRKLALGIIHRTNVESQIAPGHVGAKHYWMHGLGVFKTVWDVDRWVDKPLKKEGESDDNYAIRLDTWRAETHLSLPIIIQAVNPANVMPDPYHGGDLYVIEEQKKSLYAAQRLWPHLTNLEGKAPEDPVEYITCWDNEWRCDFVDNEPALKVPSGVVRHKYGFNPYTLIESGLGNLSHDAAPEQRYVGLLRKIFDLLVSESTNYTLNDILMKWETLLGGYITGADAGTLGDVKQEYGKWWPVGDKDVKFNKWERNFPPAEAFRHLAITKDYIDGHAAPRSVRGLSETGVRSGADRRLVMAEAAAIYRYASPAFAHGWANILTKCALLVKNVIPGDFEIWARTPTDEFDVVIKKSLMREPFNFYVEFAPISEEDEYRRHDDLERMVASGIVTQRWASEQMSNVDPIAMEKEREKGRLRLSPSYNQVKDQYLAYRLNQVLAEQRIDQGVEAMGGVAPTEMGAPGRRMSPNVPERAPPGSGQDLQNKLKQLRSQVPMSPTQGQFGGGNR